MKVAERLAAAILSDLRLYNGPAISRCESVALEVDEGRALFQSRVTSELHPVFEAALAASELAGFAGPDRPTRDVPRPATSPSSPAPEDRWRGAMLWIGFVLFAVAAALAWRALG